MTDESTTPTTTTLLIVDDEKDLRDILSETLTGTADKILVAADGQEAIEILGTTQVDCILSDFQMPRKTGLELLTHVTAKNILATFVMLTGHHDQEKLAEALRLGALDFIGKPFESPQVIAIVGRALEIGKRRRAYQAKVDELCSKAGETSAVVQDLQKERKMLNLLQVSNSTSWKGGRILKKTS